MNYILALQGTQEFLLVPGGLRIDRKALFQVTKYLKKLRIKLEGLVWAAQRVHSGKERAQKNRQL